MYFFTQKNKKKMKIVILLIAMIVTIIILLLTNTHYNIVFKDDDGTILYTEKVKKETFPIFNGEIQYYEEKEFVGWYPEIVKATCDKEYTAVYSYKQTKEKQDKYYKITFYDSDGITILETIEVKEGTIPKYDESIKAYPDEFEGWDKELDEANKNTSYIAKVHEHIWNLIESKEETCTEDGYNKYECVKCYSSFTQIIKAKKHNYLDSNVILPTCTSDGYTEHFCINCGDRYTDNDIPALGHDYVLIEADKTVDEGDNKTSHYDVYKCSRCEEEREEFLYMDFDFLGNTQEFTVPADGLYLLEIWGAQGGGANGGKGAYAYGKIELHESDVLYVVIGGQGTKRDGGFNGGGRGQKQAGAVSPSAYGGGGATHIATSNGLLSELKDLKENILIVAGAGGGASESGKQGGAGGYNGEDGIGGSLNGKGGTQTTGGAAGDADVEAGSFGQGGNNDGVQSKSGTWGSGGGGGGYYGGGASSWNRGVDNSSGGGGGSSYIDVLIDANVDSGINTGNGKARITPIS